MDPTAPPPVEVLTAAPPPLPPENGISAIRGVEVEPGVPDLTRGRRPVSPPFARMARASGVVTVDFSVSAGGITAVQRAEGPEVFRPAAVQAVESWVFRRTRADRADRVRPDQSYFADGVILQGGEVALPNVQVSQVHA